MNFRDRYSNKFRRFGSPPKSKRPFDRDRGNRRGERLTKHFQSRRSRSPRSRYPEAKRARYKRSERNVDSPRHLERTIRRRHLDYRAESPNEGSEGGKYLFLNNEESYSRKSGSPVEWSRTYEERQVLEEFDRASGCSFQRRSFSRVDFQENCGRSVENHELQTHGDFKRDDYESSFMKCASPVENTMSFGIKETFSNDYRRSLEKSVSPVAIHRNYKKESSFEEYLAGRSPERYNKTSIEQEIRYEKRRQRMLIHQKRFHEKRSESSIERFLDDCKKLCEKNNSSKDNIKRSLTPVEKPRKFEGLHHIVIERGRSFERSQSPIEIPRSNEKRNDFFNKREELQRSMSPSQCHTNYERRHCFISGRNRYERRFRSPEESQSFGGRDYVTRETSYKREYNLPSTSLTRTIKRKDQFSDYDKINESFDDERFLYKRPRLSPISHSGSFKKRKFSPGLDKRPRLSPISHSGSFKKRELSPVCDKRPRLSPISHSESYKRREFSPGYQKSVKELSPISQLRNYGRKVCSSPENRLELLPPIPESDSFKIKQFTQNYELPVYGELELSPQHERFKNMTFSESQEKPFQHLPILHTSNFETKQNYFDNKEPTFQKRDISVERPTENMEQFLAELERSCEMSSSSNETSVSSKCKSTSSSSENQDKCLNESDNAYKIVPDPIFGGFKRMYEGDTENVETCTNHPNLEDTTTFYQVPFYELSEDKTEIILEQESNLENKNRLKYNKRTVDSGNEPSNIEGGQRVELSSIPYTFEEQKKFHSEGNTFRNKLNLPDDFDSSERPFRHISEISNQKLPVHQISGKSNLNVSLSHSTEKQNQNPNYALQLRKVNIPLNEVPQQHLIRTNQYIQQPYERPHQDNPSKSVSYNLQFQQQTPYNAFFHQNLEGTTQNVSHGEFSAEQKESTQSCENSGYNPTFQQGPKESVKSSDGPNQIVPYYQRYYRGNQNASFPQESEVTPFPIMTRFSTTSGHMAKEVITVSDKLKNGNQTKNARESEQKLREKNINTVVPDCVFIERFRDNPPSPEELGEILEGFVILFDVKNNSEPQKDPYIVIQDSFSKSDRFGSLEVEFQDFLPDPKHVCVLRWRGIMLAKADGASPEVARYNAGISLINALAQTCYTIQTKYSYYCGEKLPLFMSKVKDMPGIYKIVPRDETVKAVRGTVKSLNAQGVNTAKEVDAKNIKLVLTFIDKYFKNDTYCELLFGGKGPVEYSITELKHICQYVQKYPWLQWRWITGCGQGTYAAVYRRHTPQQLRSYLLSLGGDTLKYKLIPPQGEGVELLTPDAEYSPEIIKIISQNIPVQYGQRERIRPATDRVKNQRKSM